MDLLAQTRSDADRGLAFAQQQRDLIHDTKFEAVFAWCQAPVETPIEDTLSEQLLEILVAQKRHMGEDIIPLWTVPSAKLTTGSFKKRPLLKALIEEANRTSTVKALPNPSLKRARL